MTAKTLIAVPTLNGPDRLERLLTSIEESTDLTNCTVLVADDGSTEENLKLNKDSVARHQRIGVELLYGQGRTGIAATWNRLCRHVDAEVYVLVNDDAEVERHWLEVLRYSVLENPRLGMVSLNWYGATTKQALHEKRVLMPRADYAEAKLSTGNGNLLSSGGVIFAFTKKTYEAAGGFDERYFCLYEEVDFGVTLRKQGYQHAIASYPICYHLGAATNSNPANLDAESHLRQSRRKFHEKWGGSPEAIRRELAAAPKGPPLELREWNTTAAYLVD